MDADTLKKKLKKQSPLMISPMGFALAACGGGGKENSFYLDSFSSSGSDVVFSTYPSQGQLVYEHEVENNDTIATANIVSLGALSARFGANPSLEDLITDTAANETQDIDVFYFESPKDSAYVFNYVSDEYEYNPGIDLRIDTQNGYNLLTEYGGIERDTFLFFLKRDDSILLTFESSNDRPFRYDFSLEQSDLFVEYEPNSGIEIKNIIDDISQSYAQSYPINTEIFANLSYSNKYIDGAVVTVPDVDLFEFVAEGELAAISVQSDAWSSYADEINLIVYAGDWSDSRIVSNGGVFKTELGTKYSVAVSGSADNISFRNIDYSITFNDLSSVILANSAGDAEIIISPDIGYFFIAKISTDPEFIFEVQRIENTLVGEKQFGVGIFADTSSEQVITSTHWVNNNFEVTNEANAWAFSVLEMDSRDTEILDIDNLISSAEPEEFLGVSFKNGDAVVTEYFEISSLTNFSNSPFYEDLLSNIESFTI